MGGPLLVPHLTCVILGYLQWHKTTSWKLNMMIILPQMPALLPSAVLLLLLWVTTYLHCRRLKQQGFLVCNILFFYVQLMALLLLRHALTLTDEDDDDTSAMFSVSEITILKIYCWHCILTLGILMVCNWQLFLLRAAGFLLPFYIMAWAISILQRRRQRQVS